MDSLRADLAVVARAATFFHRSRCRTEFNKGAVSVKKKFRCSCPLGSEGSMRKGFCGPDSGCSTIANFFRHFRLPCVTSAVNPPHSRPRFEQRWHAGLVSSHLIWRSLCNTSAAPAKTPPQIVISTMPYLHVRQPLTEFL